MNDKLILIVLTALLSIIFASCKHNDPEDPFKPAEQRTILAVDLKGNIYDITGKLVKTLPNCEVVTQIITEGTDYFVSGINSKTKVGYWKNGKWNTLHVDFIDDVDHWTYGIAKWDYTIYLLDYPNVLRNSGIFRLKDSERFSPARHGISVAEGDCYVVGTEVEPTEDYLNIVKPVIYKERKGAFERHYMPLPPGVEQGYCNGIHAYEPGHYVAGGRAGRLAAVWEDDVVYTLPRAFDFPVSDASNSAISSVDAIVKCDGHIYAAGVEYDELGMPCAVLWIDGAPHPLRYNHADDRMVSSIADLEFYGPDVYVLTNESPFVAGGGAVEMTSIIWLNGNVVSTFKGDITSIAIY